MTTPNLLFIGPDKAGSSWLYHMLRTHPGCYIPPAKDIYYFDRYYDRGPQWYASFFKSAPDHAVVVGEICHDYLYSAEAAERISTQLPEVKLMTILRDPVDRTFSHYLYMIRSGRTTLPFREALDTFPELLDHSTYSKYLRVYMKSFPAEQLGIFYFEELVATPELFARKILSFLGLPWSDEVAYMETVRPASRPRNFLLAHLVKIAATQARDLGLANLVGRVKNGNLMSWLYKPYTKASRPNLELVDREFLKAHFSNGLKDLGDILPGSLPVWLGEPETAGPPLG